MRVFQGIALSLATAYAGAAMATFCDDRFEREICQVQSATYAPINVDRGQRNVYPDFSTLDLAPYLARDAMMPVEFRFDLSDINLRQQASGIAALTVFELGIQSVNDDGSGGNRDFRVLAMKLSVSPAGKPNQLAFYWREDQVDWEKRKLEDPALSMTRPIEALPLRESTTVVRVRIEPTDSAWSGVRIAAIAADGLAAGSPLLRDDVGFKMPPDVTWVPDQSIGDRVNRPVFLRVGVLGGDLQRAGMKTLFGLLSPDVWESTVDSDETVPNEPAPEEPAEVVL